MFYGTELFLVALAAAFFVGVAKTGLPGLGIILAPMMAVSMPAKDSVGVLVLLLIVGDIFALLYYRQHADGGVLKTLLPYVFVGICAGSLLLARLDHESIKKVIGGIVFCLLGVEVLRRKVHLEDLHSHRTFARLVGIGAGFCTVIGNAAGPLMSVYFVLLGMEKSRFMGTSAWFFFIVNTSKVPVYLYLGVLRPASFHSVVLLIPAVVVGAFLGARLLKVLPQRVFNSLILGLTAVAAGWLLIN